MGNYLCGSGVRQTKDGITISTHEARKHYEEQLLKKLNPETGKRELYPFWKTTFPEDVDHLGPGVSIYFHHLKLFGAYYLLMSVFALGICLLCMEVDPSTQDVVTSASIGNLWKHNNPPDFVVGGLDMLMMLTFLLMCYLLPTGLGTVDEDKNTEQPTDSQKANGEQCSEEENVDTKPQKSAQSITSYVSSRPRAITWLPSQFSVRIGSIPPQKKLDVLIYELWDYGEIVEMIVISKSGKASMIHFANNHIDPVSIQEMEISEYGRKVPVEKYAQHYKNTEARVEAALKSEAQQPLLSWPSTQIILDDPLLCYVTYLNPESAEKCLKYLKGCPCWCDCLAFTSWCTGFQMTAVRPKEPSDVLWTNLRYSWGNRVLRRFASLVISIGLVMLNVFTLFHIQKYKNTHVITKFEAIALGLVIVSINEFLKFALRALAHVERHYSYSGLDTSIARSKFCVEVANNIFIIILLFGVPGSSPKAGWYSSGAMVVIAIMASDAVVPNLVQFFHPKTRLMRMWAFYHCKNQRELNLWFEEPKLELWVRFTGLLGSNFICLWFASAVPMLLPLAAFGVGAQFLIEKYNVLRQYQRPVMLDTSMAVFVRHMAPFAVLFHCVFALLVYRSPVYEKMFELEYWGTWKWSDFNKWPILTPAQWPILVLIPITTLFILYVYSGSLWRGVRNCLCGQPKKNKNAAQSNYRIEMSRDCENYARELQKAFCYTQPVQIYPVKEENGLKDEGPVIVTEGFKQE